MWDKYLLIYRARLNVANDVELWSLHMKTIRKLLWFALGCHLETFFMGPCDLHKC